MSLNDPVIDEVREVRHRISERCGHDSNQLIEYYIHLQRQYEHRLIGASANSESGSDQRSGRETKTGTE
jgi:hypothetical protein